MTCHEAHCSLCMAILFGAAGLIGWATPSRPSVSLTLLCFLAVGPASPQCRVISQPFQHVHLFASPPHFSMCASSRILELGLDHTCCRAVSPVCQTAPAAPFHAPPSLNFDTMSAQIGTSQRALHRKTSFQTSVAPDTCSCPGLPQLLSQALHHLHSAPHTHCRGTQVDGPTSASPVETAARSGSAPAAPKHARTPDCCASQVRLGRWRTPSPQSRRGLAPSKWHASRQHEAAVTALHTPSRYPRSQVRRSACSASLRPAVSGQSGRAHTDCL